MKGLKARTASLVSVLILALTMSMNAYASTIGNATLIQRENTVEGYTEISSTSTSNYNLTVKRADDKFDVFLLTDITWTTTNGIETAVVDWNAPIKAWIANPANGFTDSKYATPGALGAAEDTNGDGVFEDESSVVQLLRAIREDETLMASLATYKVAYHTGATYDAGNSIHVDDTVSGTVTPNTVGEEGNQTFSNGYTLSNMPFGLSFINATGGTRTYQPVLVNFMPVQVGPTGHWYIKNNQQYSLKYEDVGITKKINGQDYDIVREGEMVNFDVTVEIPIYQKNGANYEYTLLNAYDDMSQGFTLIPTSATLYYENKAGTIYHPTANMNIDAYHNMTVTDTEGTYETVMATEAYIYYSTTDNQDVLFGTKTSTTGQIQFWGMVNGYLEKLGAYSESTSAYSTVLTAYNTKLTAAGLTPVTYTGANIAKRTETKSVITIKLNYTKLMDTLTYTPDGGSATAFVPYKMHILYSANVNNKAYVGNDSNTNDVYLYYIGDSSGTVAISQDEVLGWTYAANIVKIDGDTYQKTTTGTDENGDPIYADPTYLENAIFDLYRSDIDYCGGATATTAPVQTDYAGYSFYSDSDGHTNYTDSRNAWVGSTANSYSDGLLYKAIRNYYASNASLTPTQVTSAVGTKVGEMAAGTGDYSTLDLFINKYAFVSADPDNLAIVNEYILPDVTGMSYQYVPVLVDSCDNCPTPHYHVHAHSVFWSDITSTNTADGITVTGLDPNTYLLVEKTAPDNYNALSEAIQFEVKQYDGDQYTTAGNSYKGFISDDGTNYTDGIYAILVKNFTGLVLPSTGGMGTLLFTILGILIMGSAFIVVLVKNKKKAEEIR